MAAVWLGERSMWVLLRTAAAALMMVASFRLCALARHRNCESVRVTGVPADVLSESQERFFQTGAGNFQPRERRVAGQQCAHDRLGFASTDLHRLTVRPDIGDAGNL